MHGFDGNRVGWDRCAARTEVLVAVTSTAGVVKDSEAILACASLSSNGGARYAFYKILPDRFFGFQCSRVARADERARKEEAMEQLVELLLCCCCYRQCSTKNSR